MSDNRQGWLILGAIGAGAGLLSAALIALNGAEPQAEGPQAEELAAAQALDALDTEATAARDAGPEEAEGSRQRAEAERREREREALAAVNRARKQSGSANLYQFIHQAATRAQQGESGVIEISNRGARISRRLVPSGAYEPRRNPAYRAMDEPEADEEAPAEGRSLADILAEAQRELRRRQAKDSRRIQALEPSSQASAEAGNAPQKD